MERKTTVAKTHVPGTKRSRNAGLSRLSVHILGRVSHREWTQPTDFGNRHPIGELHDTADIAPGKTKKTGLRL